MENDNYFSTFRLIRKKKIFLSVKLKIFREVEDINLHQLYLACIVGENKNQKTLMLCHDS